jgi:hypothetical protein
MASIPTGVQIYFLVSAIVSFLAHYLLGRYVISIITAALLSPVVFSLVCFLMADTPKTVDVKIFILFASISFLIAMLCGLPFILWRKHTPNTRI